MRIRALLLVVALVCSAGACTSGSTAVKPSATPSDVDSKAEQTPLRFGVKPLWSGETKGVPRYADQFALHGDRLVVVSGPKGGEADRLSVTDSGTGRVRWSVRIWTPLPSGHGDEWDGLGPYDPAPQVVDRDGDWGVLIRTTRKGATRQLAYGLALLSGEDGHVLWRRSLVTAAASPPHDRYVYPGLLLSDGTTAVASMRPSKDARVADLRLIAVDTRTGKRLWTRSGIQVTTVVSGSVVAIEWPDPASTPLEDIASGGTVTALDSATGRTRWSLPGGGMTTVRVVAAAGGVLLVRGQQGGRLTTPILLDLATGTRLGSAPAGTGNCADDRTGGLIACDVEAPGPGLITIRADERKVRFAGHAPPGGAIALVRDGRIYYCDVDTPGQEVDRSGTPLGRPLPEGFLSALSGMYAVFRFPDSHGYRVYRVG